MAGAGELDGGAADRDRIDAVVLVEALVLERQQQL